MRHMKLGIKIAIIVAAAIVAQIFGNLLF